MVQKGEKLRPKKEAKKKGDGEGMSYTSFVAALTMVVAVSVPFWYFAIQCYQWGHANKPEGYDYPHITDFKYTLMGSAFLLVVKYIIVLLFNDILRDEWCKKQDSEELQRKYAFKACISMYKFFYFSMSVIWGYIILKDSVWLPRILFGQNPDADIYSIFQTGFVEVPKGFKFYAFFTYGYHFAEGIDHALFQERQSDYREMLIHHIATSSLYPGYLMANLMGVGGIIGWIHDISDVFIAAARFANSLNLKITSIVSYIGIMTTWQWTRTGLLPFYFYHTLFNCKWEGHPYFAKWLYFELVFLGIL